MVEESPLLQKLSEVVARVKTAEREKEECLVRITTLEREVNEFRALIAMAESKAEELLQPNQSRQQRVPDNGGSMTAGRGIQDLVGRATSSQAPQSEGKRPFQPF